MLHCPNCCVIVVFRCCTVENQTVISFFCTRMCLLYPHVYLYSCKQTLLFQTPTTEQEWLDIAKDFHQKWQFNHCLGAIDGKHITILPPAHSGSTFRNYKGRFSVQMMAVVDARYGLCTLHPSAYGCCSHP